MKYRSINSIESSKKNAIFGRYGSLFALCFRVIIYVVINLTWQCQWHKNERAQVLNQKKKTTSHTNNGVVKQKDAVDNNGVNHLSTKYGLASCFNCAKKDEMKAEKRNSSTKDENENNRERKKEEKNEKKTENKPKTKRNKKLNRNSK